MVKRICQNCGKEFYIYPAWVKKGGGLFCSKICFVKFGIDNGRYEGKNNPNWGKHPSKETREKIGNANRGKKSPFNTQREIKCDFCGKKTIKTKYLIEKCSKHFCNAKCHSKYISKECKNGNINMAKFNRLHTQEEKDKISLKLKGNKHLLGHKRSKRTKIKDSLASKNKWKDPEFRQKILKVNKRRPTNPEKIFDDITPDNVRYVGNGQWWRQINSHSRNPDFKITNQNKVIEIYGDYWHRNDNPDNIIEEYKSVGLDCLVFWEHEVYKETDKVISKVKEFIK